MTPHEILSAGTSLLGSVAAMLGSVIAQADQPAVASAGALLGIAGVITAFASLAVPIAKIVMDTNHQKTVQQLEIISQQLDAAKAQREADASAAKRAVDVAEARARQAIAAAEKAAREVKAMRNENVALTRQLADRLDQRHDETRQVVVAEVKSTAVRPRVLIVDDHKDTCLSFVAWLEANGFEGSFALTIGEAEQKLHPKLVWIFIDWSLPDGCGLDLLVRLKKQQHVAKVIVITGNTTPDVDRAAWSAYAEMVLRKPLRDDDLDKLLAFMRQHEEISPRPHMSDIDMPVLSDSGSNSGIIPAYDPDGAGK